MSNKLNKSNKNQTSNKSSLSIIILLVIIVIAALSVVIIRGGKKEEKSETKTVLNVNTAEDFDIEKVNGPEVVISVKDYGDITLKLDQDSAPISVENFTSLIQDGFYDGLTFHRIISGFMIQGGDPLGTGMGGSDKKIKGEFVSNGVYNAISHKRGVVSMARSNDPDSASSQFFIVHQDSPHLDGNYAAFGYVTDGMEIVDKICEDTPVQDGNGSVKKEDQPVIEKIVLK